MKVADMGCCRRFLGVLAVLLLAGGSRSEGQVFTDAEQAATMAADSNHVGLPVYAPEPTPFEFVVYTENDSVSYRPQNARDENYTHGTQFDLAFQPRFAQAWAKRSGLLWDQPESETQGSLGLFLGQTIYTPRDIELKQPLPAQRPYAGWLFGGVYVQRSSERVADHISLDVGMVGPSSLAEDIQTWFHDIVDFTEPRGWDNQIEDTFAINFEFQRAWNFPLGKLFDGPEMELLPYAGFQIGTVIRHIRGGAVFRMGWNLPPDFGPGRLRQPKILRREPELRDFRFYGYVRGGGRVVEHNVLLEGDANASVVGRDPKVLVGELELGLAAQYKALTLGYYQVWWTDEFKGQAAGDTFGGYALSLRFLF